MIKSFFIENYKSWREPTEISFLATSIKEHQDNIFGLKDRKEKLLKNIVLYGANASGKSNLMNAMYYMQWKVMELEAPKNVRRYIDSMSESNTTNLLRNSPAHYENCYSFAGNEKPSVFEITFLNKSNEYSFGFEIKNNYVRKEWLDINGKPYYERNKNTNKLKDYKFLLNKIPKSMLYLTYINEFSKLDSNNPLSIVIKFFRRMTFVKDLEKLNDNILNDLLVYYFKKDLELTRKLRNFLTIIDFGIKDISIDTNKNKIEVIHYGEEEDFNLSLSDESDGTKKTLLVLISLIDNLRYGGVIVADEFTSSLHPLLSKVILDVITDPEINSKNTQIIFTTHDVFLMSKEQFRRDEILFVYKDNHGTSTVERLYDIKDSDMNRVRNDSVYFKNYLKGLYSGVPNIKFENLRFLEK